MTLFGQFQFLSFEELQLLLLVHLKLEVLNLSLAFLLNLPKPLKEKATIGLICPGGGFDDYKPIKLVVKYLQRLNYKVKLGSSLISSTKFPKYLSGLDNKRKNEFVDFWNDNNVDAIFCLKGGYGCLRLLEDLNFNLLERKRKILLGFSDVTILLLALYKKCNLMTFHGPLIGRNFIKNNLKSYDSPTEEKMWKLLKSPDFKFSYSFKSQAKIINPGKAIGRLLGGNFTSICSLLGTEYLPDFKNTILFLEDCNEEPYRIDRMLTQLKNAGIFKKVSGIVFGTFHKCAFKSNKEIASLIKDRVESKKIPILFNAPIGHGKKNYILPVGQRVILDVSNANLSSEVG